MHGQNVHACSPDPNYSAKRTEIATGEATAIEYDLLLAVAVAACYATVYCGFRACTCTATVVKDGLTS